jgi:Transcription factor WhiB
MTWRAKAACAKADPNLFFPEEPTLAHLVAVKKKYCDVCPVRQECLEEALSDHTTVGIHGSFQFPVVSSNVYAMELLRLEGKLWSEIAELHGCTAAAANAQVGRAFRRADLNCERGVQYLGRGQPVKSKPIPGLKVGQTLTEAQDSLNATILRERAAGKTFPEIAELLGMTKAAVACRHKRAKSAA